MIQLFGNDDERGVSVHVEDLHPSSRIRSTVERDRLASFQVGVSRDVVRSLVASYRYNLLILKGDAGEEELRAEIDRDCVSLALPEVPASDAPLYRMFRKFALALRTWPVCQESMQLCGAVSGPDWYCGFTHCMVQIPRKPVMVLDTLSARPGKQFGQIVCAEVAGMCGVDYLDWGEMQRRFDGKQLQAALEDHIAERYPDAGGFWHVLHDYTRQSRGIHPPFVGAMFEEVARAHANSADTQTVEEEWKADLGCAIMTLYNQVPDVAKHVGHPPMRSFDLFCRALRENNFVVLQSFTSEEVDQRQLVPLVFPTMWHTPQRKRGSVNVLLESTP